MVIFMYKAIIVDDEKLIREGMIRAIPWKSIGIDNVFSAKSGTEALTIIRNNKPELMISDIRMGEMTGLELIMEAKMIVPDMRVLILTGYDDFEYAKRCIQLNVNDFFLKPIDEDIMIEAIRKQVKAISEINAASWKNRAKVIVEQIDIEKTLNSLVNNSCSDIQIESFCAEYKYDVKQNLRVAVLIPTLYSAEHMEEYNYATATIKKICIGLVDARNRGLTFIDEYKRIVIVFFIERQKDNSFDWLRELTGILSDEFDHPPKTAVGNPVLGFSLLNISYNEAISLLSYENEPYVDIIQTAAARSRGNLFRGIFSEIKTAICSNINDTPAALNIYDFFVKTAESYNLSDDAVCECCYELASSLLYAYTRHVGKETDERLGAFMNSIINSKAEEQYEITKQFIVKLLEVGDDFISYEFIEKAKNYINDHLSDDLSMTDIASYIHISPNYLSRLFKKTTGEGCYEFVIRKRMDKAKLLLETTNLKPQKIAAIVGYNDTNYFSLAVKKSTGMSPLKYRAKFQNN